MSKFINEEGKKKCEGICIDKSGTKFRVAVTRFGRKWVSAQRSWSTDITQKDAVWSSPGLDGKGLLDIGSRVQFYWK